MFADSFLFKKIADRGSQFSLRNGAWGNWPLLLVLLRNFLFEFSVQMNRTASDVKASGPARKPFLPGSNLMTARGN